MFTALVVQGLLFCNAGARLQVGYVRVWYIQCNSVKRMQTPDCPRDDDEQVIGRSENAGESARFVI